MTAQRTLDVAHLPVGEVSEHAPLWWGQLMLAFIEASMFFILLAMYFYIRLSYDMWPPPGIQLPPVAVPAISLVPLLVSALGSYLASEAAKKNDRGGMLLGLGLNLVLATAFMVLRGVSWSTWNFNWKTGAYGSIVWSIMWLHTLDALADMIFTAVLILVVALGHTGVKQRIGVHVDSILWYFIVLIWLPLYVAIYWGPYIVGAPK
jgi:heme/copper-type cytochrome/quinol oxidase subunit 3